MGFIKWLYIKYKEYKIEKCFPKTSQEEQEKIFFSNFTRCLELGFSKDELLALLNLISSSK